MKQQKLFLKRGLSFDYYDYYYTVLLYYDLEQHIYKRVCGSKVAGNTVGQSKGVEEQSKLLIKNKKINFIEKCVSHVFIGTLIIMLQ